MAVRISTQNIYCICNLSRTNQCFPLCILCVSVYPLFSKEPVGIHVSAYIHLEISLPSLKDGSTAYLHIHLEIQLPSLMDGWVFSTTYLLIHLEIHFIYDNTSYIYQRKATSQPHIQVLHELSSMWQGILQLLGYLQDEDYSKGSFLLEEPTS